MPTLQPLYTVDNCTPAYQLDWSLSVFWKTPPRSDDWLTALQQATEDDGVRILNHRFSPDDTSLFLVSSKPDVTPIKIAGSVKGRLQYLVRDRWPKPFQRNYDLRSVGSTKRDKLEAYVASQIRHHPPADPRLQAIFADLQIVNPDVDLSRYRTTAHARYWANLHLVLVHDWRSCELRPEVWLAVREMIRRVAAAKGHLLSRVGLVPDHLHMTLGILPDQTPFDVALCYMNNLAYAQGMQPVFMPSCYLGTFGEYDLGAIRDGDEGSGAAEGGGMHDESK